MLRHQHNRTTQRPRGSGDGYAVAWCPWLWRGLAKHDFCVGAVDSGICTSSHRAMQTRGGPSCLRPLPVAACVLVVRARRSASYADAETASLYRLRSASAGGHLRMSKLPPQHSRRCKKPAAIRVGAAHAALQREAMRGGTSAYQESLKSSVDLRLI